MIGTYLDIGTFNIILSTLSDFVKKRQVVKSETSLCDQTLSLSFASVQLTRDADVQFYTGLSNTKVLKTLFDHLSLKASVMHYWKVPRQTLKQAPMKKQCWDRTPKGTFSVLKMIGTYFNIGTFNIILSTLSDFVMPDLSEKKKL
jgi:hypothetical protein